MILRQYRIFRADLMANPRVLYAMGDNEERVGLVGQTYGAVKIKPDTDYRLGADGVPVEIVS